MDAYKRLSDKMTQLQQYLSDPQRLPNDPLNRIDFAKQFRMELWNCIADYRDARMADFIR